MRRQDARPPQRAAHAEGGADESRGREGAARSTTPKSRQVVTSLVKQRQDSIEQFTKGGRQDLADKEAAEIAVLESYLPPAADPAVVERAVADAIAETGATSPKDIGRVMKAAMARLAGQTVDGKTVNELVRQDSSARLALAAGRPPDASRAPPASPAPPRWPAASSASSAISVLAALFGAGNEMDAFIVAFRIPNLVARSLRRRRDERRVRPDLHPPPDARTARPHAWRLGNNVLNALLLVDRRRSSSLGMIFARPLVVGCTPATTRPCPGKLELTIQLTRDHAAVPHARGDRRGDDGHAELAPSLLRAGALAGDVQRRDDRRARSCSRR